MEKGDISSITVPRLLIEFEDILGTLPDESIIYKGLRMAKKWDKVVEHWEFDEIVARLINDRYHRMGMEIEIITLEPPGFSEALAERLDKEGIDVNNVWTFSPNALGRKLATMLNVAAVYTTNTSHALKYGSKGRLVTPENVLEIGRF